MAEIQTYPSGTPVAGDKFAYISDPAGAPALKLADVGASGGTGTPSVDDPATYTTVNGAPTGYDQEFDGNGTTLPAGWSWVGQGDASYVEHYGAGCITTPGQDYIGRYLVTDAPRLEGELDVYNAPWTVTAKLTGGIPDGNYSGFGLVLFESASGKSVRFENANDGGLRVRRYQSDRATSDGNYSIEPKLAFDRPAYLRIVHTAGFSNEAVFTFGYSFDGIGWLWHNSLAPPIDIASWISPNKIGFFVYSSNGRPVSLACHWFRVR